MKVVVLQSNYLPWKGYFDLIHDADTFIFYDEVKYTKNDWRNRNKIYSKNGLQWLTIPIEKEAVKLKISEVCFKNELWQQLHLDSLYYAYKKAKFFNQLEELLFDFYKEKKWMTLSEFNQYSIQKISKYLGIKTRFTNSKNFILQGGRVDRLIDLLGQVGATQYISGPSAKDYLNESEHLFLERNIELKFKSYVGYPAYPQRSLPFENSVSIIDLIANVNKDEIPNYIWNWRKDS